MSTHPTPTDWLVAQPVRALLVALAAASLLCGLPTGAQPVAPAPTFGQELEGFSYPYPVANFHFASQRQDLQMAYMDVAPATSNGQTAVLFHGKNFCAATWKDTIDELTAHGYRVRRCSCRRRISHFPCLARARCPARRCEILRRLVPANGRGTPPRGQDISRCVDIAIQNFTTF